MSSVQSECTLKTMVVLIKADITPNEWVEGDYHLRSILYRFADVGSMFLMRSMTTAEEESANLVSSDVNYALSKLSAESATAELKERAIRSRWSGESIDYLRTVWMSRVRDAVERCGQGDPYWDQFVYEVVPARVPGEMDKENLPRPRIELTTRVRPSSESTDAARRSTPNKIPDIWIQYVGAPDLLTDEYCRAAQQLRDSVMSLYACKDFSDYISHIQTLKIDREMSQTWHDAVKFHLRTSVDFTEPPWNSIHLLLKRESVVAFETSRSPGTPAVRPTRILRRGSDALTT